MDDVESWLVIEHTFEWVGWEDDGDKAEAE